MYRQLMRGCGAPPGVNAECHWGSRGQQHFLFPEILDCTASSCILHSTSLIIDIMTLNEIRGRLALITGASGG